MTEQTTKEWLEVTRRWESYKTQRNLIGIIDDLNRENNFEPYFGQMIAIILGFVSTIYTKTYSYDNLTRTVFAKLCHKMPHTDCADPDKLDEQRKLLTDILKIMPKGFKDYTISGGVLTLYDDKSLSVKKANEFIDFIRSDQFEKIIIKYISRQYTSFSISRK